MISPVRIIHEIEVAATHKKIPQDALDGYIEQVLVRRELAFNFIYFEPGYDQFDHMTYEWAYKTMQDHADDAREYTYTIRDYESLNTDDIYFNKAMQDMMEKGTMPNYMRMYWGKKIIEWSNTYEDAYTKTLYLNNKYFLDGRDANSYTGVAWLFGRHDRAWTERAIFGKLRYMNQAGLTRKFDMDAYLKR
jgi:deoxyribodipyrimidine photo-lyase